MNRVELADGYTVSRLINGVWQLSEGHRVGGFDRQSVLHGLRGLVDAGLTTFDCADIYTGVEELLGDLLREVGNTVELQIHTKYVPDLATLATLGRRDVAATIDRSLERLGVERLDLVQFHWWDYAVPRYVEVAQWLSEIRLQGKIRWLGTTNFDTPHLEEMVRAGVPIVSNQLQYSLLDRRSEARMVDFCRHEGIQILSYGTMAGGFLSPRWLGTPDPGSEPGNRSLTKYRLIIEEFGGWSLFQELLTALSRIAQRHSVSLSNVAVRWVLDRPGVAAALVGARGSEHLHDNLQLLDLDLDEQDRATLEKIVARSRGPRGEPFALERIAQGPHARIMRTDLNRAADG